MAMFLRRRYSQISADLAGQVVRYLGVTGDGSGLSRRQVAVDAMVGTFPV